MSTTFVNNNPQLKEIENNNLRSAKFKVDLYLSMPHIPKASERAKSWDKRRRSDTDTFGI
jgi:hypothetical protein